MKFFYNLLFSLFICLQFFASNQEPLDLSRLSISSHARRIQFQKHQTERREKDFILINKRNIYQQSEENLQQKYSEMKLKLREIEEKNLKLDKENDNLKKRLSGFNQTFQTLKSS